MIINEKDARILKRLTPRSKFIIILLLILAFIVGLSIPLIINQTTPQPAPSPSPASPATTLKPVSIHLTTDSPQNIKTGANFDVSIKISSPNQGVDAADFIVYFDPSVLKPVKIMNGDFFQSIPVKKISANNIKISAIALLTDNKIIFPQGEGSVATITFDALKGTKDTLVYFDPDKTIVAHDGKNVLMNIKDLHLSIK